jgi:hypothetical protein
MQHIANNSEVATKQVLHFIHNHHALALQLSSCVCPDDDCLSDQTSTMNNYSLPSPEFNRLSGCAHGCSGDDFGMYPWGMVGCTGSRRMGAGPASQQTIFSITPTYSRSHQTTNASHNSRFWCDHINYNLVILTFHSLIIATFLSM